VLGVLGGWRADAEALRRHGLADQAASLEQRAREIEEALAAESDEALNVAAAAKESGYSAAQLRRLFPGQRRLRRGDLPRKGRRPPKGAVAALVDRLKVS
jgi:enoyl-CoA hydratase/carnithine racemase